MTTDEILTSMVNFAHTLSPQATEIFLGVNQAFTQRLKNEY